MLPNYYESVLKHMPPEFFIDETFRLSEEINNNFISTFEEAFKEIGEEVKNIKEEEQQEKEEKIYHFELNVNKKEKREYFLDINVTIGENYQSPLKDYGEEELENCSGVMLLEILINKPEKAQEFYDQIMTNILPRVDEFVYYQKYKSHNGHFKFLKAEKKVALALWREVEYLRTYNKVCEKLSIDLNTVDFRADLSIGTALKWTEIKDSSFEEFVQKVASSSMVLDIRFRNLYKLLRIIIDVFQKHKESNLMQTLANWLSFELLLSKVNLGVELETVSELLVDVLAQFLYGDKYWFIKDFSDYQQELYGLINLFFDMLKEMLGQIGLGNDFTQSSGFQLVFINSSRKKVVTIKIMKKPKES